MYDYTCKCSHHRILHNSKYQYCLICPFNKCAKFKPETEDTKEMSESSIVFKCQTCNLDNITTENKEPHEGHILTALLIDRTKIKDNKSTDQLKLLPDKTEKPCRCGHNERIHSNHSRGCLYSTCKCEKYVELPEIPHVDDLVKTFTDMMGEKVFLTIRKEDESKLFNIGFWLNNVWTNITSPSLKGALIKSMTEMIKGRRGENV